MDCLLRDPVFLSLEKSLLESASEGDLLQRYPSADAFSPKLDRVDQSHRLAYLSCLILQHRMMPVPTVPKPQSLPSQQKSSAPTTAEQTAPPPKPGSTSPRSQSQIQTQTQAQAQAQAQTPVAAAASNTMSSSSSGAPSSGGGGTGTAAAGKSATAPSRPGQVRVFPPAPLAAAENLSEEEGTAPLSSASSVESPSLLSAGSNRPRSVSSSSRPAPPGRLSPGASSSTLPSKGSPASSAAAENTKPDAVAQEIPAKIPSPEPSTTTAPAGAKAAAAPGIHSRSTSFLQPQAAAAGAASSASSTPSSHAEGGRDERARDTGAPSTTNADRDAIDSPRLDHPQKSRVTAVRKSRTLPSAETIESMGSETAGATSAGKPPPANSGAAQRVPKFVVVAPSSTKQKRIEAGGLAPATPTNQLPPPSAQPQTQPQTQTQAQAPIQTHPQPEAPSPAAAATPRTAGSSTSPSAGKDAAKNVASELMHRQQQQQQQQQQQHQHEHNRSQSVPSTVPEASHTGSASAETPDGAGVAPPSLSSNPSLSSSSGSLLTSNTPTNAGGSAKATPTAASGTAAAATPPSAAGPKPAIKPVAGAKVFEEDGVKQIDFRGVLRKTLKAPPATPAEDGSGAPTD